MSAFEQPAAPAGKLRLVEIPAEEMWTDFLEQVNDLMIEEKKARQVGDHQKLAEICTRIVQLAYDQKELVRMREFFLQLCKRRGQAKKPVVDMVTLVQKTLFEQLPTRDEKYKMLEAIREAAHGKMFLEKEYADATMDLCKYLEEDGKKDEATDIIQEIQIETYGSLEIKDKLIFILYQMKLVLMRRDFVRCQILSRKISKRHLGGEGLEALKIEYYLNMIRYYIHEKMIMDACKSYQIIFDTIAKAEGDLADQLNAYEGGQIKKRSFENYIIYLLVSPYDNEKVDMMNIVKKNYARMLEDSPELSRYVDKLLNYELMPFSEDQITTEMIKFQPFREDTENSKAHLRDFLRQLIQHNLRVVNKYYSRITISTLSKLIGVPEDRAEQELCDMVVNKRIEAKINRLEWQVTFHKTNKGTEGTLENWNQDIKTLLDKVEQTCQLINREKIIN